MEQHTQVIHYVQQRLFALQDLSYRKFQAKLMPTVDKETVIGVRTPQLRAFAKTFGKTAAAQKFLEQLPHTYYEENNLHGMLLGQICDYPEAIAELDRFLLFVNNWATCDLLVLPVLGKHLDQLVDAIDRWLASKHTYTVRFAIGLLMRYYLEDAFCPEYPNRVMRVCSEEYYINMMRAWYFATALAKQSDAILPYFTERRMDPWTHNKAIQKAIESCRITPEQKAFLRTLRMKTGAGSRSVMQHKLTRQS